MELDEKTYGRILKKCDAGDALMDNGSTKVRGRIREPVYPCPDRRMLF